MKRLIAISLCTLVMPWLLAACSDSVELDYRTKQEIEDNTAVDKASHALLFYFVGTDLDRYFGNNIAAVKSVVDRDILGSNRIAYFRCVSGKTWAISEIYCDPSTGSVETEVLKRYEDADLTQMETYLSDMISLVPAESYGLILGGHGSGWLPKSIGSSWTSKYRVGSQDAYIAPFGQLPCEGAMQTRYFGETTVNFDLDEIAGCMEVIGAKFDYMIFDDCFMSNIESLYAMRRAADYIIASPCEIMAEGFPYKYVIPQLFADGGPDLEGVCRAFYEYYNSNPNASMPSGCVALTVCSELEAMAEAYRDLVAGPTRTVDVSQLQYYEGLSRHLFYDFGQYAGALSDSNILLHAFKEQFDRTFPESCRLHTPSFYSWYNGNLNVVNSYSGVTVSEPADRNVELNRETEWYRATH